MANIEEDKPKENKETPITDPCANTKVFLHQSQKIETSIVVVEGSGDSKHIGLVDVCMACFWLDDKRRECFYTSAIVRKFKNWPYDLNQEKWETVAAGGPSYWDCWAVHACRMINGVWLNFNELHCIPPFDSLDRLKTRHRKVLEFRAKYDPTLPPEIGAMFGVKEPPQQSVAAVVDAAINDAQELEDLPF
jgi:hypothetical protein